MKKEIVAVIFCFIFFSSCSNKIKKIDNREVIDKTEEYVEAKISWVTLKENESIDGYTRINNSIYGGEISCDVEPLKSVDLSTFRVLPGTKFAKDKNHVYYPLRVMCVDYIDCGVCFYSEIIVEKANPKLFKYLEKDYATDGTNVYFRGELIVDADGKTFRVIEGPEFFYFAVDKNKVYKHAEIFEEAAPSSFIYDKENVRNLIEGPYRYIIKDKNNVWEYTPPHSIKKINNK